MSNQAVEARFDCMVERTKLNWTRRSAMKNVAMIVGTLFLLSLTTPCEGSDHPLSMVFKGLEPGKMPIITVTNTGHLDIDDIMGGFSLLDSDGNVLFSTGYTDMVTGSVWLAAGQSMDLGLFVTQAALDRNPPGKRQLIEAPQTIQVVFSPHTITFVE